MNVLERMEEWAAKKRVPWQSCLCRDDLLELIAFARRSADENAALRHYVESVDAELAAWHEGRGAEYVAEATALEVGLKAIAGETRSAGT